MISAKAVKTTAKEILKGNWANAMISTAVPVLATAVIYIATYLLSLPFGIYSGILFVVSYIFLLSPLWLGVVYCYWLMANNIKGYPTEVFYYFSNFKSYRRAVAFTIKITFRIMVFSILFFLPSIIINAFTNEAFYELIGASTPLWVLGFKPIYYVFRFVGIVLLLAYLLGIMPPLFLVVANEEMSVEDCIKRGINIGIPEKSSFAAITWSYIGYILLSLLIVPVLFTVPYLIMSYIVTCRFLITQYNLSIEKTNEMPTHEI